MNFAVLQFPASNCDQDAIHALRHVLGQSARYVWHKEKALGDVERMYPAKHYVMIDDKLRILAAIKKKWKDRVTTVFPKQGHYANDDKILADYPPADVSLSHIGALLNHERSDFLSA